MHFLFVRLLALSALLSTVIVATGASVGRRQSSSSSLLCTIIPPSRPIFTKNEEDEHHHDLDILKIGFLPGCVLRVPNNYKQVPRPIIELAYWGLNGVRRTVVLDYQAQAEQQQMELKDVKLIIQRAVPWSWYKRKTKDIEILDPRKVTSNAEDVHVINRNRARKPVRIERVQLQSMKRVVTTEAYLTADDKKGVMEVLESLLLRLSNDKCAVSSSSYDVVLPIELLTSFPKELLDKGSSRSSATKRFIFAHEWKNVGLNLIRSGSKTLQALVIDFDAATGEALTATMYSYM